MRVLVLSQYYPPEPAEYVSTVAESLAARGHSVRVLTGFPNYPEGHLHPGYRQVWRHRDRRAGIDVRRVPLYPSHSSNPVARVANLASFAASSSSAWSIARGADVIYVYATQMTAALGPWLWRIGRGAPYVLHILDLWPDSIVESSLVGSPSMASGISHALEPWMRSAYRRAGAVIGIAPTMVEMLAARGVPADRLHLLYNWESKPPQPIVRPAARAAETVAMFAGNVGDMQDLETVVRAVHAVRDTGLRMRVVGDGIALDRVRATVEEIGATNTEFVGRVPLAEMTQRYAEADFALVPLKSIRAFDGTIPSKFQAAMAHGVPVITSVRGDLTRLVHEHRVGFTAEPESQASLEAALRRAVGASVAERDEMSMRATALFDAMFSEEAAMNGLERILREVAAGR